MKKLLISAVSLLLAGALSLRADNYVFDAGTNTYTYTGTPVSELVVDFSTWSLTDLPAPLSDQMALAEKGQLGFVKWKIANRPCGSKGSVNALFNNDNSDFAGGPKNNVTTNRPRIYLPTTTDSVRSINVFGGNGKVSLFVRYKDANHSTWTDGGAIALTSAYANQTLQLNSVGPTTIYLEYGSTSWIALTDLTLDIVGAPTPVADVRMDIHEEELQVGNTLQLTATVLPDDATDKTVTWTTSNEAAATVSESGLVTGVASGTATIYASAGGKKDSCVLEIKDLVVKPTAINWNVQDKSISLSMGDSLQLSYTITPANATNTNAIMMSTYPTCASIDQSGMVRTYGGGEAILRVILGDLYDEIHLKVLDPNMPIGELDWDQDGTYWGDSVDYIYDNFNTWPLTALRAEMTSEDIQQYKKLGFIRWNMTRRLNLLAPGSWDLNDQRNCLFTNNPEIDGFTNVDSAHYARIFLPVLRKGAGALRIEGYVSTSNGNGVGLQISFYNTHYSEETSGYTFIKSVTLPGDGSNMVETGLDIEEPVTLCISYKQSPWPSLYSIQVSPYGCALSDDPDNEFGKPIENGLDNPQADFLHINQAFYNILGQQVTADYKGIVIQNGKKFIRK